MLMVKLLGTMLVKAKIITEAQLEDAINSQVIFGGRIGTNLLELGYIDEPTLSKFLSDRHDVPYVDLRGRVSIDPEAVKLVPKKFAAKIKAIPLKLEDKILHAVFLDPSDLDAVHELKFQTGKNLKIYVAPEFRIYALLEKVYGIKRDIRYITLSRRDTEEMVRNHKLQQEDSPASYIREKPAGRKPAKPALEPLQNLKPLEEGEDLISESEFRKLETETVPSFATEPVLAENKIHDSLAAQDEVIELTEEVVEQRVVSALSFQDAMQLLNAAKNRDELANILLGFCMNKFTRSILYTVQRDKIIPWDCLGSDISRGKILGLAIPLTQPSIFKLVYDTKCHFLGPIPNISVNDFFLKNLGNGRPASALLMPIMFNGKLVLIIYGDNGKDEYVSTDIGEILILAQRIPIVIKEMVRKRKEMFKAG